MPTVRPTALFLAVAVAAAAGCGPKRIGATRPATAVIVLLPDPETAVTGRAQASNPLGSVDLATPRAATRVTTGAAPAPVTTMSEADVNRLFGAALAALPTAPRHFTLNFRFESDVLTDESTALVPEILGVVKGLSVPEVIVVGHTDTSGDPKANVALGMSRANSVRDILINAGLAPTTIQVTSHGEADLLVQTPNDFPEPRNRRVEITVR